MNVRARSFWKRLIDDRLVLMVIALNAIALVLRGFAEDKDGADHPLFWIEYGCAIYFVIELAIKVRLLSLRDYWRSTWNRIDAVLVVVSTPLLLEPFLDMPEDIAVLLTFRLIRLARLTRLMAFVPGRERLWIGLSRALKAALGVSFALALYCALLALWACHMFHDLAPEYFRDPVISFYSMFKVFTVEGWYEIPDTVAEASSPGWALFARMFFMMAVVSGGLLGLSLANAIFVDEMVMDNNAEVEDRIESLRQDVAAVRDELVATRSEIVALLRRGSPDVEHT